MQLLKSFVRNMVSRAGGVLLSYRAFDDLLRTRAAAIAELTAHEQQNLKPGLSGIVFSKDRALQMHALLFSYAQLVKNPAPLTVIYAASTEAHANSYKKLISLFPKVKFVRETNFRATLLDVLSQTVTRNLFFLVDDIIIIRPMDLTLAATVNPLETVLSLRLSPHLRFSYTANVSQMPPAFTPASEGSDVLEFEWFREGNEWSYPYSVDGHVFSTAEIRVLSRLANFRAPNTYEGALMGFHDLCENRRGLCYTESKVLNLPFNRVQDEVANFSDNISPDFLLQTFNAGKMLDMSHLRTHIPRSPHEVHTARLVTRV